MIVAELKVTVSILKKWFDFQFPVFHFRLWWISSTLSLALPGCSQTFWPCCSSSRWGGRWVLLFLKILALGRGGDINNTTLTSQGIRDKLLFNPTKLHPGKAMKFIGVVCRAQQGVTNKGMGDPTATTLTNLHPTWMVASPRLQKWNSPPLVFLCPVYSTAFLRIKWHTNVRWLDTQVRSRNPPASSFEEGVIMHVWK